MDRTLAHLENYENTGLTTPVSFSHPKQIGLPKTGVPSLL